MTESLMKFVLRFRMALYIVFFIFVVIATFYHKGFSYPSELEEPECFWPPDLVPHPHPPPSEPKDDNMA